MQLKCFRVASIKRRRSSDDVTSPVTPRPRNSLPIVSIFAERARRETFQPRTASSLAIAWPIPWLAAVMRTTLSLGMAGVILTDCLDTRSATVSILPADEIQRAAHPSICQDTRNTALSENCSGDMIRLNHLSDIPT